MRLKLKDIMLYIAGTIIVSDRDKNFIGFYDMDNNTNDTLLREEEKNNLLDCDILSINVINNKIITIGNTEYYINFGAIEIILSTKLVSIFEEGGTLKYILR